MRNTLFAMALALAAGESLAATLAADDASNYTSWTTGSNGGVGFGPWDLQTVGNNNTSAFSGHFLASGPGDLNFIGTGAGPTAWGLYANDTSDNLTANDSLESAGAIRSLTGGALDVGQAFVVRMEHGNIDPVGTFQPANYATAGHLGWVGIILNPSPSWGGNAITGFGQPNGPVAFGFTGGQSTYSVWDNASPSGRQFASGVPFTRDGLEVRFEATSSSTTTLTVTDLGTSATYSEVLSMGITNVTTFGLFNRNSEEADVFFNSVAVVPEPTSALLALATLGIASVARRR
jgi:hypothetical protein